MWIRKLSIKNFGPFEDYELDLTRGSIGIFGPNGSGKSTIVGAMFAALTNNFSWFDGLKVDNIRNTADKKAPSSIAIEVLHGEHVLKIHRGLRPSKSELKLDDLPPITGDTKIQPLIDEALGIDSKMLDLYVFKRQDKIYDFLTTTPTERAKAYQTLCRTEQCEEAWTVLGDFLNKDPELRTELVDNSDELLQQIAGLEVRRDTLDGEIQQLQPQLLNEKSKKSAETILQRAVRFVELGKARQRLEERLPELEKADLAAAKALLEHDKAVAEAKKNTEALRQLAQSARVALENFKLYRSFAKQKKELEELAAVLVREEAALQSPDKPEMLRNRNRLDDLKKEIAELDFKQQEHQRIVTNFEDSNLLECPTCGTPVEALEERIEAHRNDIRRCREESARLSDILKRSNAYYSALDRYESELANHNRRKTNNEERLAQLVAVDVPAGDEAELKGQVQAYDDAVVALEELNFENRNLQRAAVEAQSALKQAFERRQELLTQQTENKEDPDRVEAAKKRLTEHQQSLLRISTLQGELKGITSLLEDKQGALDALRARLGRNQKLRRIATIVEKARDVLHRDRLPRRVARMNLLRMEGDINRGLKQFGDPYWAETDENLSFIVHKPGEPPQAATRLSTGWRVVLALAFWPAVGSLWSSNLGMLALDEPTANLDEENRKALASAMAVLTDRVRGDRQIIMVSHDPNLKNSFDQVVELGA